MKQILFFLGIILATIGVRSQTIFISKGKIEFERKTNTHRLYFSGEESSFWEEFKKLIPQFKTDYFNLFFNEDRSIYKIGKESNEAKTGFFQMKIRFSKILLKKKAKVKNKFLRVSFSSQIH